MQKIVLASSNPGKVREIQALLAGKQIEVIPQSALNITDAEETGLSFLDNALIKARHAAGMSGLPAIADDSGLAVDALNGAPGVFSARYAGPGCNDADNNRKLLAALHEIPEPLRTARFHCAIVMLRHADDPSPLIGMGAWEGQILTAPHGSGGFGYDPLFYVTEIGCAAAELSLQDKNRFSHRAQALRALFQLIQRDIL